MKSPPGSDLYFEISGKPCFDLDNRWSYVKYLDGTFWADSKYHDYPVLAVSWYGAVAFCTFLSEMAGLKPCYNLENFSCDFSKNGFRLPTSTEWEYAARYKGPEQGTYRIIRGGSWLDPAYMCRVGRFKNGKPDTWCGMSSCDLGFRVARSGEK